MSTCDSERTLRKFWAGLVPAFPEPQKLLQITDPDERAVTMLLKTLYVVCRAVLEERQQLRCRCEHPSSETTATDAADNPTRADDDAAPTSSPVPREQRHRTQSPTVDQRDLEDISILEASPSPRASAAARPTVLAPVTVVPSPIKRPQNPPPVAETEQPRDNPMADSRTRVRHGKQLEPQPTTGGDRFPPAGPAVLVPETVDVSPMKDARRRKKKKKRAVPETQAPVVVGVTQDGRHVNEQGVSRGSAVGSIPGVERLPSRSPPRPPEKRTSHSQAALTRSPVLSGRSPATRRARRTGHNPATPTALSPPVQPQPEAQLHDGVQPQEAQPRGESQPPVTTSQNYEHHHVVYLTAKDLPTEIPQENTNAPDPMGSPLLFPQHTGPRRPPANSSVNTGGNAAPMPPVEPTISEYPKRFTVGNQRPIVIGPNNATPPRRPRSNASSKLSGASTAAGEQPSGATNSPQKRALNDEGRILTSTRAPSKRACTASTSAANPNPFPPSPAKTPTKRRQPSTSTAVPQPKLRASPRRGGSAAGEVPAPSQRGNPSENPAVHSQVTQRGRPKREASAPRSDYDLVEERDEVTADDHQSQDVMHDLQDETDMESELFVAVQPNTVRPYDPGPVRKKADRKKLPGWACDVCKTWYEERDLSESQIREHMDRCSRHRQPARTACSTPPGFWDPMTFPATETTQYGPSLGLRARRQL